MKVAPKLIFLFRDSEGFGASIADALHPNPISSLRRLEDSFELSLERYGIKDFKACGNLVHFVDDKGIFQVSVLLLQNYELPVLACAVNEVLAQITGETSSTMPTFVVPVVAASSKLKWEGKTSLYGMQIGPETDITRAMVTRIQKPPSTLQIHYEPLACFLQLARVLKLPTFFILGQRSQRLSDKASGEELEILNEIGELLVTNSCLSFLRDRIMWNPEKTSRDCEEPWRALYG